MPAYTLTAAGRLLGHYIYFEPVPKEERPNRGAPENLVDAAMETLQRKIRGRRQMSWLAV